MRAAVALCLFLTACDLFTSSRAAKAGNAAEHSMALAECRAEGKDAGSYAVYARCADEADRKYGLDAGVDGGGK